jgi:DNA-binding LacI/PurR family transcriptional regulator/signal transduction histidine kinase
MNLYAGGFEEEVRNHFFRATQSAGIDILFVYGRNLDATSAEATAHNSIFDRLPPERVDGIILLSTSLCGNTSVDTFKTYAQRFSGRPQVSIGLGNLGIPSIIVDGHKAIGLLVEHLIITHERRRIAFIGGPPGNPEAEARLSAYLEALERHQLPHFPEFLVHGYFARDRGRLAMLELLDRRLDLDAVVCANDTMAFGAYDALRSANLLVPQEISVTGFDDVLTARICNPPLSTVTHPFFDVINSATRLILCQLLNESVPEVTKLDAQITLRNSCGCNGFSTGITSHSIATCTAALSSQSELFTSSDLIDVITPILDGFSDPKETATQLIVALKQELKFKDGCFLTTLRHIIEGSPGDGMLLLALQRTMSRLRRELLPITSIELENIWHDARDILSVAASAGHVQRTLELHAVTIALQSSNDRLADALDISSLTESITFSLRTLGCYNARITRFDASKPAIPILLVDLCNGDLIDASVSSHPGHEIFAPNFNAKRVYAGVLFPLTFEGQMHGIAAFSYLPQVRGYQLLRDQISAALRNVTKHENLLSQTRAHERITHEREATAKRLDALSVLAGSIAHDLNNALGPVGLLLEMMVSEIQRVPIEQFPSRPTVLDDAETISQSISQSAQIVLDLLTLGRQGRAAKHVFDFTLLIKRVIESESTILLRRNGPPTAILFDLPPDSVFVRGAEVQLSRVLTNLFRNAIDASTSGGSITIALQPVYLNDPLQLYETILPGNYARMSVTDQGCGIEPSHLNRIFEPYFSKKIANDRSGTGLGLAIVHAVVKDHEGFIDVESSIGVGSVFRIYLPLAQPT